MQTSMSGISVSEDSVNLFYLIKAKSTVRWAGLGLAGYAGSSSIALGCHVGC